jgi:hypothetical protein
VSELQVLLVKAAVEENKKLDGSEALNISKIQLNST